MRVPGDSAMMGVVGLIASTGSPWSWHPHPVGWVVVIGLAAAYISFVRSSRGTQAAFDGGPRPLGEMVSRRQRASFGAGLLVLLIALGWPLADIADSSLLARMAQRSLLLLVAPPLLLLGLPRWLVDRLTRPAIVDNVLGVLTRPVVATLLFNAAVVASFLPAAINGEARSSAIAAGINLGLLAVATIMWMPALRTIPGEHYLSTGGRAGYLMVQAILPTFPALVFIFAQRPLYSAYVHAPTTLGLSPLLDQQIAGALAKVAGLGILLGAAGFFLLRWHQAEETGADPDPLLWDDVERELRRVERRSRKSDSPS
ncbi:MAG TPA: cytochrome c oxidase assembly protein [Acidimicrobiales bacterium]|nr:cytochrome c oxidase assembly protein [Acidimicrobiales bacterium]